MWQEKNQAICTHILIGKCDISQQLDNGTHWVSTTRSLGYIYQIQTCLHASDHNTNMQCLNLALWNDGICSSIRDSRYFNSCKECAGRVNTMQINSTKPINLACSSVFLSLTLNSPSKLCDTALSYSKKMQVIPPQECHWLLKPSFFPSLTFRHPFSSSSCN